MQEFFKTRTLNYNIRNFRAIQTYRKNTIAFGIETVTSSKGRLYEQFNSSLIVRVGC